MIWSGLAPDIHLGLAPDIHLVIEVLTFIISYQQHIALFLIHCLLENMGARKLDFFLLFVHYGPICLILGAGLFN